MLIASGYSLLFLFGYDSSKKISLKCLLHIDSPGHKATLTGSQYLS